MRFAIVTPHPVPFALGGAENLWWGLQSHIENETPHSCDIVSFASPEGSFVGLVDSYEAASKLDLSGYDRVISGKYPGWMAGHANHTCYMLHRLRGLYDTYGGGGLSDELLAHPQVGALVRWMREHAPPGVSDNEAVFEEFFARFRALKQSDVPSGAFAFPGPLARETVRFLDDRALARQRIERYAAISATVARRPGYFPDDAHVDVLHPPPHRDDYRCGGDEYLFVSSRLDGPKRIGLLIQAMAKVKHDIPLLIAGSGPEEARLKELAGDDPRVRFLGFVPDADMPGLYADALAVPFVPYDEDYGLITIEAMRSGKPVITCTDSGGPCEFVREGETGLICRPEPDAVATGIDWLCRHRAEARAMGAAARASVAHVTWENVFAGLAGRPSLSAVQRDRKPKLTVATTFPVWPPMGGGQARVFHLYRALASQIDVEVISLGETSDDTGEREIAPGFVETRIPKSRSHQKFEQEMAATVDQLPIGDIAAHFLTDLTPAFREALDISALSSQALVACHPYLVFQIQDTAPDRPLWYEAQDVELELKEALLPDGAAGRRLIQAVEGVEAHCWRAARHVFACSQRDLDHLQALYGPSRADKHEVPNGVALDEIRFVEPKRRRALKHASGLNGRMTALFMGSWHGPNLEAVEKIIVAAREMTSWTFVVMGSSGLPFRNRSLPANVMLLGQVENHVRDELLAVADVALNPMESGSGTNLKMLDYFAAGIPVLSTVFGARGLKIKAGEQFLAIDECGLSHALERFHSIEVERVDAMVSNARRLVEEDYAWTAIAERFIRSLADAGFDLPVPTAGLTSR